MAIKTEHIVGLTIGGGLICIGGYLLWDQWTKSKLVAEFMDKVSRAEIAYRNAIGREDYEEAQSVAAFYEGLMHEEEEVIKAKGTLERLLDALAKLGIVVSAGYVGASVIKWLIKRFPPPPPYKCPLCGAAFSTPELLDQHVRQCHPVDEEKIAEGQAAYNTLPGWIRSLVGSFSGIEEWMLAKSWQDLPRWQILALAAAAVVIIALCWWLGPGVLGTLGRIAAMAKPIPVPA
jgi:hypothetical protein